MLHSPDLTEEFDAPAATWDNYDAYVLDDRENLRGYAHVDVRAMDASENWVGATFQKTTDNRPYLSTTGTGTRTITSVADTLDLSVLDGDLSIALPNFPTAQTDLSQSFIEITSHESGSFTSDTDRFLFNQTVVSLASQGTNVEARWPLALVNADPASITGVRIVFKANSSVTYSVAAIRVLPEDWVFLNLAQNTRLGQLRRTFPRNGQQSAAPALLPLMWRSATPSSDHDPRPVDAEFGVIFNTGGMDFDNTVVLYFREVTKDFLTMLDLNAIVMDDLNGHDQPDLGEAMYNPRTQADLDLLIQDDIQADEQFTLERTPDYLSASYIQFSCKWTPTGGTVEIIDTEGNGYPLNLAGPLTPDTEYVFYATLEDNSASAAIYNLLPNGRVGSKVFDSTTITDDFAFKRRLGRFGWFANLIDGDAYIDTIRERSAVFGEYRSLPFVSNTPVRGVELSSATSPPVEHLESLAPGPYNTANVIVSRDTSRSTTGESWRIDVMGDTDQGFQSNLFFLTDFENSGIRFDLFYPADVDPPEAYLLDAHGNRFDLLMPRLLPNQWQSVQIAIPFGQEALTGRYRFVLTQPEAARATWWVDNAAIFTRTVVWSARNEAEDPWKASETAWIPFRGNYNRESGGVQFPNLGSHLQVRAKLLTHHGSSISRIQFKPKYAELGRAVPSGVVDRTATGVTPTITTSSPASDTRSFTAGGSVPAGSTIALYEWAFGDGSTALGKQVTHTYVAPGLYTVTLVTTNNFGIKRTITTTVNLSF